MIVALLALTLTQSPARYEELVELGINSARNGQVADAVVAFGQAITLDRRRPEAFRERGGLRFLQAQYDTAVEDLARSLDLREDEYTRDLLASSLFLGGRIDEALSCWNVMGRPLVSAVRIRGLQKTKDRVARREVPIGEGEVLTLNGLREGRNRLKEAGIFDRIALRPVPTGAGRADLEVALLERHGLYSSLADFVATTVVYAIDRRVRLRYSNFLGEGISFGAQYRWQDTRPEQSVFLDWPRPLGAPSYLHLRGSSGKQTYALDETLVVRTRGGEVNLRQLVWPRGIAQIGLAVRDREFSRPGPASDPGLVVGFDGRLESRLLETHRHRLGLTLRLFGADSAFGSDLTYAKTTLALDYVFAPARPEGSAIEPSILAGRLFLAAASSGTPLDDQFAVGGSNDMEYPLRGHSQRSHGALGRMPIGRELAVGNLEWRFRVRQGGWGQLGMVAFADLARIGKTVWGQESGYVDVGLGLRLALRGSGLFRLDWGHGLTDGSNAYFIGVGQSF